MKDKMVKGMHDNYPLWLNNFVNGYQKLSVSNLDTLEDIYDQNIIFCDPMHQIEGYESLYKYFENLYKNLQSCTFVIDNVFYENDQAAIYWQMTYQHPKLNGGDKVVVCGHSHIKGGQDKVLYHRDYLDLGAMLYEQLPVFGKLTKWLKKRAVS